MPIILTVLSEHVTAYIISYNIPLDPLSTNEELMLCLCTYTLYILYILNCMYLIPPIVVVVPSREARLFFCGEGLLLLFVDSTLRISAGKILS